MCRKTWNRCGRPPARSTSFLSEVPLSCTFCYRNFGRKVVYDSPEHVPRLYGIPEDRYDTVHFVFCDELFNVDQHWVTDFCDLIAKSGHNYLLSTNNGYGQLSQRRERHPDEERGLLPRGHRHRIVPRPFAHDDEEESNGPSDHGRDQAPQEARASY